MRLRTQTFLVSTVTLTAVIAAILAVVIPSWQAELEQEARRRGRLAVRMLARSCAEPAMVGNYSELQGAIDDAAAEEHVVFASIIDRQGNVVVSSRHATGEPFFVLERPPPDPAQLLASEREQVADGRADVGGHQVLDFVAPLAVYKRSWGYARLGISRQPMRQAAAAVTRRMVWLGLGGVVLGAVLSLLLAAGITRPLAKLAHASRGLSERQLDIRVQPQGARELVQLGEAFNQMADSIQGHVDQVQQKSFELEAGHRVLAHLSTTIDRETLMAGVLQVVAEVLQARCCELIAFDARRQRLDHFVCDEQGYESTSLAGDDLGADAFQDIASLARERLGPEQDDLYVELAVDEVPRGGLLARPAADHSFERWQRKLAQGISQHILVALENASLYELAIHDSLTGLTIRRYFLARLREQLDLARRYEQPFGLLMIDIDHFKKVNDSHGHLAGDRILRALAARLQAVLRSTDLLSRYGGEELVALLPQQSADASRTVAEKLRMTVAERAFALADAEDHRVDVTISIGVATYPAAGDDADALLEQADQAMYAAKRAGRDCVR